MEPSLLFTIATMSQELLILITALVTTFGVWLIVLTILSVKQQQFLQRFTTGLSKKDLKSLLETIDGKLDRQDKELEKLGKNVHDEQEKSRSYLQKYALVRFNPFDETGGDQSFSLSMLNGDNEGFVVTSLHSRDVTRVYAKDVRQATGSKKKELSKEEHEAIAQATKGF